MAPDPLLARAVALLRTFLARPDAQFRAGQWEAIRRLVQEGGRQLVVQRTGWGKSIVYFLATALLREQGAGPTLLVSPLLSLMRNQVLMAARFGLRAGAIHAANREVWDAVEADLLADRLDVLLVAPERLANAGFLDGLLAPVADRIGLFVVDEAHCISDWGHDFRPDYQRIRSILRTLAPTVPVLATTATANARVVDDIRRQLGEDVAVERGPLARPSLCLQALALPGVEDRYAWLAAHLPRLGGSGIVYVLTRRDAERLAGFLRSRGIDAEPYMGDGRDVEPGRNERLEQRLLAGDVKALIATPALGMGFDKPDLAFVVHFQRPGSVVHYYQQVGRAGRALDQAYGILLAGAEDREINEHFIRSAIPRAREVEAILQALAAAPAGLTLPALASAVNLGRTRIDKALRLLAIESPAPIARSRDRWRRTPFPHGLDARRLARLSAQRRDELAGVDRYVGHDGCLMVFLQRELDDVPAHLVPCGRCAPCRGAPLLPPTVDDALRRAALVWLQGTACVIEPHRLWPAGHEALYVEHGWHGLIPDRLRAGRGRALGRWNERALAEPVRQARRTQAPFAAALVQRAADLVSGSWCPQPAPTWVTAVPSLRRPRLVADLARRVATHLGLPFHGCVLQRHPTRPQRARANSQHRLANLAGAFFVHPHTPFAGPVLLVDDLVDSRWTLTVIAALLGEAGSGPVHPLVLVSLR